MLVEVCINALNSNAASENGLVIQQGGGVSTPFRTVIVLEYEVLAGWGLIKNDATQPFLRVV